MRANPKVNQPWIVIRSTDTEAETPILWPPDTKSRFTGKDSDAGKDWRQEEKGTSEDEMVGWHHRLNGHQVWANSGRWSRTGKPGVLQSMGRRESIRDCLNISASNTLIPNALAKLCPSLHFYFLNLDTSFSHSVSGVRLQGLES